ncbi:hypothetical protein [Pseudomonas sp. MS19]|uniref:hypothetical protein n=1 Tax=Pseudomonas sp. MS19 TaxID=2579939 RepID=UPI001562280D|nr:hypothetical protein [Pseudomonas sp. MS19]NRH27517.1 hypothetical protein [Pseudomonas sp. MS19]
MEVIRNSLQAGLITVAALLAGCGGGAPSVEDAQAALMTDINDSMAAAKSMGLKINLTDMIKVKDVKNCEESRDDVFQCSVEATAKMFGVEKTSVSTISFTKNSEGEWRVVQ